MSGSSTQPALLRPSLKKSIKKRRRTSRALARCLAMASAISASSESLSLGSSSRCCCAWRCCDARQPPPPLAATPPHRPCGGDGADAVLLPPCRCRGGDAPGLIASPPAPACVPLRPLAAAPSWPAEPPRALPGERLRLADPPPLAPFAGGAGSRLHCDGARSGGAACSRALVASAARASKRAASAASAALSSSASRRETLFARRVRGDGTVTIEKRIGLQAHGTNKGG